MARIPSNITNEHLQKAIEEINRTGIPPERKSDKYDVEYQGNYYPSKYVISIANRYANGRLKKFLRRR